MSNNKLAVTLDLYYGEVTYNAKQEVTSRKEPVTIIKGLPEWDNFLKHFQANGITKVDVVSAVELAKDGEKEVEKLDTLQKEVDSYFEAKKVELTPEQKRIKELEEKVEALTSAKVEKKQTVKVEEEKPKTTK